jgi:hypothetical protein
MTTRAAATGEAWNCPHCGGGSSAVRPPVRVSASPPLRRRHRRPSGPGHRLPADVDGTIRHPGTEAAWEYSVIIEIHDERGEMVARRVVGVGALRAGEGRKFTLRVEVVVPDKSTLTAAS